MENYFTDKEKDDFLKRLNIYNSQFSQWERKKAQKNYVDLFGKEIKEGEYYYRVHVDTDFNNDIKLSIDSMDKVLYAIFAPGPKWAFEAEKEISDRMDKVRDIINKRRGS